MHEVRQPLEHGWQRVQGSITTGPGIDNAILLGPVPIGGMGSLDRGPTHAVDRDVSVFIADELVMPAGVVLNVGIFAGMRIVESSAIAGRISILRGGASAPAGIGDNTDANGISQGASVFRLPLTPSMHILLNVYVDDGEPEYPLAVSYVVGWAIVPSDVVVYGQHDVGVQPPPRPLLQRGR